MLQLQLHTYIMMMEWNGDIIVFFVETFNIFGQHILLWLYPSEKRTERERKRVRCTQFFLLFYFPSFLSWLSGGSYYQFSWMVGFYTKEYRNLTTFFIMPTSKNCMCKCSYKMMTTTVWYFCECGGGDVAAVAEWQWQRESKNTVVVFLSPLTLKVWCICQFYGYMVNSMGTKYRKRSTLMDGTLEHFKETVLHIIQCVI